MPDLLVGVHLPVLRRQTVGDAEERYAAVLDELDRPSVRHRIFIVIALTVAEGVVRNRDVLLSTERIMEGVWDLDSSVERNVVWVFISSLRRKMESIGASCHIRAVRGIGYRLEVYS